MLLLIFFIHSDDLFIQIVAIKVQIVVDLMELNLILQPQEVPLTDSVSSICWANSNIVDFVNTNIFAATCWDGILKIYEVVGSGAFAKIKSIISLKVSQSPLTCCCWNADNKWVYVGCGDGKIIGIDVITKQTIQITQQKQPISSLHFTTDTLISSTYQKQGVIKLWNFGNNASIKTVDVRSKILFSDFVYPLYVAALVDQKVVMFNVNSPNQIQIINIDLGSQLQSISLSRKLTYLAVGSVDGRSKILKIQGRVEDVRNMKVQTHMVFRSHFKGEKDFYIFYPINSVGFNVRRQQWIMTAGSDGSINLYDFKLKNKIKELKGLFQIPVCKAQVSPRGDMIAYALGNDWHLGTQGPQWQPKIRVHLVPQSQLQWKKYK